MVEREPGSVLIFEACAWCGAGEPVAVTEEFAEAFAPAPIARGRIRDAARGCRR